MATDVPTHPPLDLPRTGSELKAKCERMRRHYNAMYDAYLGYAHDLERGLRRAKGNPWLLTMDVKLYARRTVRPLIKAAEENRRIAQAWMRHLQLFEQNFQSDSAARHTGSGHRIDVMK